MDDLKVPLMGVTGAFVFAAQMINFPIPFGTSGHLVGTMLLAVLLGAQPALLVVTCILIVQCLLFQDGGATALGANVLNMAVLPVAVGYPVYIGVRKLLRRWQNGWLAGAAVAAWLTVALSAVAASIEVALSGRWPCARLRQPQSPCLRRSAGGAQRPPAAGLGLPQRRRTPRPPPRPARAMRTESPRRRHPQPPSLDRPEG